MKIDRILLSGDDIGDYLQFLPIISLSWQKLLNIKPTLALVTNNKDDSWRWMENYCQDIIVYPNNNNFSRMATKVFLARLLIRQLFNEEICMVSDLDMLPLNASYFVIPSNFTEDKFLSLTYDAFENGDGDPRQVKQCNIRKVPSCYMVASSNTWKEIINPNNLSNEDLIKSWNGLKIFDYKEDVNAIDFCDESLVRTLVQKWNPSGNRIIGVNRGWINGIAEHRIDRSNWIIDNIKLKNNYYIDAHCPRPLIKYRDTIKKLTDYINIPFIIGK